MVYLKQTFNLAPASPETRDRFVGFAREKLVPSYERSGARLVAAWFGHVEWYGQVTQVLEFADLQAFDGWRRKAAADSEMQACEPRIEQLAPDRSSQLLEPLGPVPAETLARAIAESEESPSDAYTFAILEIAPGKMEEFKTVLAAVRDSLPIIAAWRAVAGNPNEVIDLWKGALGQEHYRPADAQMNAFVGPLRQMAPRERLVNLYPLPYSPLR